MVGNPFDVRDAVQELADLLVLAPAQLLPVHLHQIRPQLVLIGIHLVLELLHRRIAAVGPVGQQLQRIRQVPFGGLRHLRNHDAALLNGQSRIGHEPVLQFIDHGLLLDILRVLRHQAAGKAFEELHKGQLHEGRQNAEQGVHQGDVDGPHHIEADAVRQQRRPQGKGYHADKGPEHVDKQIDKGGTLAVGGGADGPEQHRCRGADGHAHDDGQHGLGLKGPCHGQGLQNTDGGGGALQHRRKHRPG